METNVTVSHTEIKQSSYFDYTRTEEGVLSGLSITQEVSHRKWNTVSSPRREDVLKGSTKKIPKGAKQARN